MGKLLVYMCILLKPQNNKIKGKIEYKTIFPKKFDRLCLL